MRLVMHRYGHEVSSKLRFADVKADLRGYGMTIFRDAGSGEYRVTYKSDPAGRGMWSGMTPKRAEDLAYYTNDLDDALATGILMSKRGR